MPVSKNLREHLNFQGLKFVAWSFGLGHVPTPLANAICRHLRSPNGYTRLYVSVTQFTTACCEELEMLTDFSAQLPTSSSARETLDFGVSVAFS